MEIEWFEHYGMPVQPDYQQPAPPPSLTEQYPHLADAAEELLAVVLEMLAYERGQKGGLYAACRMADRALAKAMYGPTLAPITSAETEASVSSPD